MTENAELVHQGMRFLEPAGIEDVELDEDVLARVIRAAVRVKMTRRSDDPPSMDEVHEYLITEGLRDNSISNYMRAIRRAVRWIERHGGGWTLVDAPASLVREYVESEVPETRASRGLVRWALRHYWRLVERLDPPLGAITVPSRRRMRSRALEPEEARRLAQAAREMGGAEGIAVLVALYSGLRREEIAGLRWSDFGADGWLNVTGKGDITADLPVHPKVHRLLEEWRDAEVDRSANPNSPPDHWTGPGEVYLFAGFAGREYVTPTTVWTWVKKVAAEAGVEDITPHRLRHTFITEIVDQTGDLRTAQELARHAKPETTAGYSRANVRKMKAAVEMLDFGEGV